MPSAGIRVDSSEVDRALTRLGRRAPRIISQSLNRTTRGVVTVMKREVARDIGIKVGAAAKRMKIEKAHPARLRSAVNVSRKRIPLIELRARGPEPSRGAGRGVTYRSRGQRKRIPHAFITRLKTGHRGVFERKERSRLPIRELFGPSVATVFRGKMNVARRRAHDQFTKELRRGIQRSAQAA